MAHRTASTTLRKKINLTTKLAAALLALRDDKGAFLIPYEEAKYLSAKQIISRFQFDHWPILHAIDPIDEPWNLQPMLITTHREKSARDTTIVAKVKRLIEKPAYRQHKRKWPKRKLRSRPFPKSRKM